MDLYLQIVIAALIPFLLLGAYYAYRFFQIKKKLALRDHVTISDDVISDLIFKVSQEYVSDLDLGDALTRVIEHLRGLVSVTAASYFLPVSEESEDYNFYTQLLYEVSDEFIDTELSTLKDFVIEKMGVKVASVAKNVEGGPLNSSSTVRASSRAIFPIEIGPLKGAISLASRKSGHFSDELQADLKKLFDAINSYFSMFWGVARKEYRKFQAMVDSMRDGVFMVDENYRFLITNPALKDQLGLHEAETVNIVRVSSFFSLSLSIEDVISEVFALGKVKVVDDLALDEKVYCLTAIPVKVQTDTVGVVCLLQDKTHEFELDRMKRDFSAMIIHELRSPLAVIRGTSDFLLSESANVPADQQESFMYQIRDSSDRLLKLVNDLLDSAKIESGKVALFKRPAKLNDLVAEQVEYYGRQALQKKIDLSFAPDEGVGEMDLDPEKMRQVVINLLSNALKYTDIGGKVVVRTALEGSAVRMVFEDTGRGVSNENKEKIFEKYKQVEYVNSIGGASSGTGRTGSGRFGSSSVLGGGEVSTGLGLAISKGIVNAHGGKIWVEDNEPAGSKFIVELPL